MRRLALVAIALGCVAAAAFGAGPNDPEISATHTIGKDGTTAEFCVTVNADRLDGKLFDVEFLGPWAPGVNAPENQFKAPAGWTWAPVGSGGWRVYNGTTPMAKAQKYCFTLPLASGQTVPNPVNLIATDQAHHPIHNFLSTLAQPKTETGIKHAFYLGPAPDEGTGTFVLTYSGCNGSLAEFQTPLELFTAHPGSFQFAELKFDGAGKGEIFRNGVFRARGSVSALDGAINGRVLSGEYRSTRSGCLETWRVSATLGEAGRVVATCPHTAVDSPSRVNAVKGNVHLRIALKCGTATLPHRRIDVYLVTGKKKQRVGSFRTTRRKSGLIIHLDGTHPNAVELRFKRQGFFVPARRRVRVVYG
jgi:hypothetical protein